MAHMIENGEMMSVLETPWHKLGTVLDNPPTTEEAIRAAKLDWAVRLEQNFIHVKGEYVPTESFSTVRDGDDKPIVLGTVTDRYTIVQNQQAFEVFDSILLPQGYQYETAGAIKGGKKVWILARTPETYKVNNDEILQYLLLVTSHDGTSQVKMFPTAVRVVCNNTLQWALNKQDEGFSLAHKGDVHAKLQRVARLLEASQGQFEQAKHLFTLMSEHGMNEMEVIKFYERIVPDLKRRTDEMQRNAWRLMFDALMNGFYYGKGNKGQTLWDAYNSVTEFVDHTRNTTPHRVLEYSMFGTGHKIKLAAFSEAQSMVTKKSDSSVFIGAN